MSTFDEAVAVKEKFKEIFWSKEPDKYNVIILDTNDMSIEDLEEDLLDNEEKVIDEDFFIKVFLFEDITDLPDNIDGVEIKYFPVIEKENT